MSKLDDFVVLKRLGEGSFGSVYQVQRKSDQKLYAMKKVKMLSLSTKEKENALNEVRILASVKNSNVIKYKEAFYDDASSFLCIIMEFATRGDLLGLINDKKKKRQYFEEETIWKYAADMLIGLKALHDKKIIHRDLKGANIFIADNNSLKLGDLNVSKVSKQDFAITQTGTPYYTAPEIWQNQKYDYKCDVWSLGCVLYEITTLEPPFKGISMEDLYKKVLRGVYQPINLQKYSLDLQRFVDSCIKVNPRARENVENLIKHPSVMKYIDQELLTRMQKERFQAEKQELLQTIKLPYGGNLKGLNMKLPKANYDCKEEIKEEEEYKSEKKTQGTQGNRPHSAVESSQQRSVQKQVVQQQPQQNVVQKQQQQQQQLINNQQQNNYYSPNIVVSKQRQLSAQPAGMRRYQSNDGIYQGKNYLPPINDNRQQNNNYHYNQQNQDQQRQINRQYSRDRIQSRNSQERGNVNYENNRNFVNENSKPQLNYQKYNQPPLPSKLPTPSQKNNLPPRPYGQRPY